MTSILPILPESLLLVLGVLVLIIDPFVKKEGARRLFLGWFTAIGTLSILAVSLIFGRPPLDSPVPVAAFGGMLRFDMLGYLFKMFFLLAAGVTALFFLDTERLSQRPEAYLLMLAATIGMCLMASSADLVMLYLAIETTSIPLYVLAGFLITDERSTEAGFK